MKRGDVPMLLVFCLRFQSRALLGCGSRLRRDERLPSPVRSSTVLGCRAGWCRCRRTPRRAPQNPRAAMPRGFLALRCQSWHDPVGAAGCKETIMRERCSGSMIMVAIAAATGISVSIVATSAQGPVGSATGPAQALKTPWGEPDLQGIWTDEFDTPLQR